MPKTPIHLSHQLEYLSILDENGKVDLELEPDIKWLPGFHFLIFII